MTSFTTTTTLEALGKRPAVKWLRAPEAGNKRPDPQAGRFGPAPQAGKYGPAPMAGTKRPMPSAIQRP